MESQSLFNIITVVAGFFGGWILNRISRTLDRIDDEIRDLPKDYVAKEDYRGDIDEIKHMLGDIYKELRNKADK